MLADNAELMRHKKQQHWKENKCPYFHAVGRGCRFPDHICFNIHWPQEEQRGRGQNQRAGGQVQRSGTQEQGAGSQMQGAGDQASWADVTRGQRVRGQGHNARENIDCWDGAQCSYFRQGDCRYRHHHQTNQTTQNQSSQSRQISESVNDTSAFNMQEMKATLDNLVKVVINVKSLADFPPVKTTPETK